MLLIIKQILNLEIVIKILKIEFHSIQNTNVNLIEMKLKKFTIINLNLIRKILYILILFLFNNLILNYILNPNLKII
jgi:hypothetical protein